MIQSDRPGPHFLAISPPRSASTWLFEWLRRHSQIELPKKEISYFGVLERWHPPSWYLRLFSTHVEVCRGDVGGLYALLPVETIRRLHALLPNAKVVLFCRNPVERLWSHIRHDFRYRVGPFWKLGPAADIPWTKQMEEEWLPYYTAFGDYGAIVERWLTVFPPERIFIAFIEELASRPNVVIARLCEFLGIGAHPNIADSNLGAPVNVGIKVEILDEFRDTLETMFAPRTQLFDDLLAKQFNSRVPESWCKLSLGDSMAPLKSEAPSDSDLYGYLGLIPRRLWLPRLFDVNVEGFNIILYEGRFHAISHLSTNFDIHQASVTQINDLENQGLYAVFDTPEQAVAWAKKNERTIYGV